ncbi:MAG: phage portal protein [Desulfobacterales bacterium]
MKIYKGKHYEVFEGQLYDRVRQASTENKARMIYIALNLAKLITHKFADLMFLDPLRVDSGSENYEVFKAFFSDSQLDLNNWKLAVYTTVRGDGLYRFAVNNNRPILKYTPANFWFPEFEGGEVARHIFEWAVKLDGKPYVRRDVYQNGSVLSELYASRIDLTEMITDDNYADILGKQVDIKQYYPNIEPEIKTGVPDSALVYHFKSDNSEDDFGQSEYFDLMPLFDELNNRLTQLSKILDVHAEPEKFYPDQYFQLNQRYYELYKQMKYEFKKSDDGIYSMPQGVTEKPFALTWDAKLEAVFKEIEMTMENILTVAEIAPYLIWMKNTAETEDSIRMQLITTEAKVRRQRMLFAPAFKQALIDLQKLIYANDSIRSYYGDKLESGEIVEPSLVWGEPIPVSESERLDIVERKDKMGAISERRKIAEANPELTNEEVDDELREIQQGYNLG